MLEVGGKRSNGDVLRLVECAASSMQEESGMRNVAAIDAVGKALREHQQILLAQLQDVSAGCGGCEEAGIRPGTGDSIAQKICNDAALVVQDPHFLQLIWDGSSADHAPSTIPAANLLQEGEHFDLLERLITFYYEERMNLLRLTRAIVRAILDEAHPLHAQAKRNFGFPILLWYW